MSYISDPVEVMKALLSLDNAVQRWYNAGARKDWNMLTDKEAEIIAEYKFTPEYELAVILALALDDMKLVRENSSKGAEMVQALGERLGLERHSLNDISKHLVDTMPKATTEERVAAFKLLL